MLYQTSDLLRPADFRRKTQVHQRDAFGPDTAEDYGRIVHSMAFRRLQGKMQLFPPTESPLIRNRLSHTLEVTDIASRITTNLNRNSRLEGNPGYRIDGYIVTAAALAHDLGHPPFGHTGEKILAHRMREYGSFEGNAQTLRIITRIENRLVHNRVGLEDNVYENPLGLNLLLRTIAGVLKYDAKIEGGGQSHPIDGDEPKHTNIDGVVKGYYADDKGIVDTLRSNIIINPSATGRPLKTIECQIMDLADDIAYSTYDFEDCMIVGVTRPLDLISVSKETSEEVAARTTKSLQDKYGYAEGVDYVDVQVVYDKLFRNIIRMSGLSDYHIEKDFDQAAYLGWNYQNSRQLASIPLKRRKVTEYLIQSAINAISIPKWDEACPALTRLEIDVEFLLYIEALKHYNYLEVINSRRLHLYGERAERILNTLFDVLEKHEDVRMYPEYWRPYASSVLESGNKSKRMRLISDFISSLTDEEATRLYTRVASQDARTVFEIAD
jgi:dGTPase